MEHDCKQQAVHVFEHTKVDDIEIDQSPIKVFASGTCYQADSLIICNGAWTGRLVPLLADTLTSEFGAAWDKFKISSVLNQSG